MPGLCSFVDAWLENPEFSKWIRKDPGGNKRNAFCCVCKKTISVASMGVGALTSHASRDKHKRKLESTNTVVPIHVFASGPSSSQSQASSGSRVSITGSSSSSNTQDTPAKSQRTLTTSVSSATDVLKAEIIWALKCIDSHYSMNSCAGIGKVFSAMFPDSKIAQDFSCGDKKMAYLCTFGLAPFFKSQLTAAVKSKAHYVLLFDETLNKDLQEKQMDVHFRFWDENRVITQFYDSMFLGHAKATDLFDKLSPLVTSLGHRSLLQLSMDGPNVNLALRKLLVEEIAKNTPAKMLDIGTCGLHVLHNAFRAGCAATPWEIECLLCSVYNLFIDAPARKEDFKTVAEASILPLKFCRHRWLENADPAQRVIDLLPNLVAFASAAKNKAISEPTCKSFKDLLKLLGDPLLKSKLEFFISVARELEAFLELYQTDSPMLPFLAEDLGTLIKNLMNRIVKEDVMQDTTAVSSYRVDIEVEENLKPPNKVDVGFAAKRSMLSVKATDADRYRFRLECRNFIKSLLKKVLEKSPIKYPLVRNLTWLDPCRIGSEDKRVRTKASKQLEQTLHILCDAGRVKKEICDDIKRQFNKFSDKVLESHHDTFTSFNYKEDRVDHLLHAQLSDKKDFKELWMVCQQILILSHSQATVERGFSIHKQLTVENLKRESLIAKRLIHQVLRLCGGPTAVPITKELLVCASSARKNYEEHLQQQKSDEEKAKAAAKRKAQDKEVDDLLAKRRRLQTDIDAMSKSADKKALDAEKLGRLPLLAESNAIRKGVQEKAASLVELDRAIDALKSSHATNVPSTSYPSI